MASIKKSGKFWRAQIQLKTVSGEVRESRSFDTKGEAADWAYSREKAIKYAYNGKGKTLGDLFARYSKEVSEHKKGRRWEQIRLLSMSKLLGHLPLDELSGSDIAQWRDMRLKVIQGASVRREFALLSAAIETARKEWQWIASNPVADVKKPKDSKPRDRRFTHEEIDALTSAMNMGADTVSGRASLVFLFAIETAMRCGEICALRKEDVTGRVAFVGDSKNGETRNVPLSARALELWKFAGEEGFKISPMQVSTAFMRARKSAGIDGVTFHDSRREATIRLSKKLDVLELAKVTGHKDLSMLLTYYRADAEALADRL